MEVSNIRISGEVFDGLPGDEEVFLEKNPLGSDSVYIRVKPPKAPDGAFKTVLLTQTVPGTIANIDLDCVYDPASEETDDKLDVIYTFRSVTDALPVQSFKVYHDHRDIALRVSTALGVSISELYAPRDITAPKKTGRSGNIEWRVSNLEREMRSLNLEHTRLKFDLDQNERADKLRDEKLAALDKRLTELEKRPATTLSADDLESLRRDLDDLKSDFDDLESRIDDTESRLDDVESRIDDIED